MGVSREIRLLEQKWGSGAGWPKRLEWIEIQGVRGWIGQRVSFPFPIMAIVGENGVGKSTVLQCAASVYAAAEPAAIRYPSDFFPDTAWERIKDAAIRYCAREGGSERRGDLRKPTERWRGYAGRPVRHVEYVDLSRTQPVSARVGYAKLAKAENHEVGSTDFEPQRLVRLSQVMGREYEVARMATTNADAKRTVPVLAHHGSEYSGFHQGAGETTVTELLKVDMPKTGILLIDEIETSLHPRAQRRLIRELASVCRDRDVQVILTTHSPYILEELPDEARVCISTAADGERALLRGVSPEFAMTSMDDEPHYECELFVEDRRAQAMLTEIVTKGDPDLVRRCQFTICGPASVGRALGEMVVAGRWARPVCVFLDGDQPETPGCMLLPGGDSPERVVFGELKATKWHGIDARLGRQYSRAVDECERAMLIENEHGWVDAAASKLIMSGETLWQGLCDLWVRHCLSDDVARAITDAIHSVLHGDNPTTPAATSAGRARRGETRVGAAASREGAASKGSPRRSRATPGTSSSSNKTQPPSLFPEDL